MSARIQRVYDVTTVELAPGEEIQRGRKHPNPRRDRCRMKRDIAECETGGMSDPEKAQGASCEIENDWRSDLDIERIIS